MTYCLVQAVTPDLKQLQWFFLKSLTQDCSAIQGVQGTQKDFIKAAKNSGSIIGVTSSNEVIFQQLELPHVVGKKLIRAIPYALEESIAENINNIHFVLLKSNNTNTVAYIRKEKVSKWHDLFLKIKTPSCLVSPINLLTWKKNQWTLVIGKKKFWLRENQVSGICLERKHLFRALSELIATEAKEQLIRIFSVENEEFSDVLTLFKKHRSHYKVEQKIKSINEVFDLSAVNFKTVNLLQNEFSLHSNNPKIRRTYTQAALFICLGIVCATLLKFYFFHALKQEQLTIEQRALTKYKQIYPNATSITSSEVHLKKILSKHKLTKPEGFLLYIKILNKIHGDLATFHVKSINYRPNRSLKVAITVPSLIEFEKLKTLLTKEGIKTKRTDVTIENQYTNINFVMSKAE